MAKRPNEYKLFGADSDDIWKLIAENDLEGKVDGSKVPVQGIPPKRSRQELVCETSVHAAHDSYVDGSMVPFQGIPPQRLRQELVCETPVQAAHDAYVDGSKVQFQGIPPQRLRQELVCEPTVQAAHDSYVDGSKVSFQGIPPQRLRQELVCETPVQAAHDSYVMTLFDRSLNLTNFEDDSSLYALGRAWAHNNPDENIPLQIEENNMEITKEEMPEFEREILPREIDEIFRIPTPEPLAVDELLVVDEPEVVDEPVVVEEVVVVDEPVVVDEAVPPKKKVVHFEVNNTNLSREELWKEHKLRWNKNKQLKKEKMREKRGTN